MTNKTVLSDNQVTRLSLSLKFQPSGSQPKDFLLRCDLVREIEQAVLQSPEIRSGLWKPIETLLAGNVMPTTVFVVTDKRNLYTALCMDGAIGLVTPFDGVSFDYEAYGNPTHWMQPELPDAAAMEVKP